ncbi:MAG: hypothetical protein AAF184_14710 [Pseudomonadota bacterium]
MKRNFAHRLAGAGAALAVCLSLTTPPPAAAQGRTDYFNVESPQVHPIELVTIGAQDFLLIVNTPDNALEIWRTDESVPVDQRFVMRLPVGLEPVSVRWHEGLKRAYVANFLGDSITAISLARDPSNFVRATLITTQQVTDAPLDMAFATVDDQGTPRDIVVVTHMTLDAISKLTAQDLLPVAPGDERLDAVVSAGVDLDFDANGEVDDIALKEPRTAQVACDRLFVIGHKGGNTVRYDFDLYTEDLTGGAKSALGGLGSQNTNMALGPNEELFVVGAMASNELRDEDQVAAAPTGFVQSMFYLVENPCSDDPVVHARDVNEEVAALPIGNLGPDGRRLDPFIDPHPITRPVEKGNALAYLTDVVPFAPDDSLKKVFFTAFSSDRIGVIEPNPAVNPVNWPLRRIDISPLIASHAGPRGLALRGGDDPRLYVLNRIDNSVTIIDAATETVLDAFALAADPTPSYITEGRRFLYDARLSGNGFVSCASCHHDGRTDGLAWDLGDGNAVDIPPELLPPGDNFPTQFDADKDFMVTQSLEGLLNFEVAPDSQELFTNAPYHWRGDRVDFVAFQGAFTSLLGGDGVSDHEMEAFEEFINSVQYAPNPKQPRNRIPSGELGDPDNNNTLVVDGSGAMLGLKFYHIVVASGNSCAGCHALPEGSDNVITENIGGVNPHPLQDPPFTVFGDAKVMETAAMRMLFQKEARLDRDGSSQFEDSPITGYEGVMHTGLLNPTLSDVYNGVASMNAFNTTFFSGRFCLPGVQYCESLEALMEFVHQFDSGVGPMVGRALTVTPTNRTDPALLADVDDLEAEAARANAGVSAQLWAGGVVRGFWFDLTSSPPAYREEPTGLTVDRITLLGMVSGTRDRLVLQGVPLGTERRVADPSGLPSPLTGPTPANVRLQPMVTNTGYAEVPKFTTLWDGAPGFNGTHGHSVRVYQWGLLNDAPNGYGLCTLRHEAPRRFRVSGEDIRHGAALELYVHDSDTAGPPVVTLRPDDPGQVPLRPIVLPLHPTDQRDDEGALIWESAAEMEPLLFYRLMVGRPDQSLFPGTMKGVTDLDYQLNIQVENTPGLFDPPSWNQHYVRVVNADGTRIDGGWQRLMIEPGPLCP